MTNPTLICQRCGPAAMGVRRCPACDGVLVTAYAPPGPNAWEAASRLPGLWRYAPLLPVQEPADAITLGEGATPLVLSARLGPMLGLRRLWFKIEAANPTGSYKDRIAAVALSRAREQGRRGWLATSSGNAGAALAAYGARAGIAGVIVVPATAAPAKLAQIRAYGAHLIAVEGFGQSAAADAAVFDVLVAASAARDWALCITAHAFEPYALDGAKSIAYEVVEALGAAPDRVYVPAGGGGLAVSIARGFREWRDLKRAAHEPRLTIVQAAGCATIATAWERGRALAPAERVETAISGVQLADPPDGELLLAALRAGNGAAQALEDAAVFQAQARLAQEEGLFVEPAAALPVAGVIADVAAGRLRPDETVVCVLTGSGFKDRAALDRLANRSPAPLPVSLAALADALATL